MEYTTLGKTGVKVSRIGFGGAPAGLKNYLDKYEPKEKEQRRQVIEAIEKAVELGITYFDTAAGYGNGTSERIFGEALQGYTDEVFIATKVAPKGNKETRITVESSLERLGCDCIDLIQIHGGSYSSEQVNQILRPGGMLDVLEQLREEKIVKFIGFTSEDQNSAVYSFIETGRFDVMQICYNFIYQHPAEPTRPFGSIYEAKRSEMGIVTMRTVTSGIFQKWIQWVNPSNEFDYSPALIQFVLSNPLVDVALIGMRTVNEVEQNVAIGDDIEGRIDIKELHKRYK